MGTLASQFLLESLLAPFATASFALILADRLDRSRSVRLAPVFALILAIGTAYVLAFGWPSNPGFGARTKILISAIIGAIAGFVLERRPRTSPLTLLAGAVAIAVWIGLPALQHGRPASALLILPICLTLAAIWLFGRRAEASPTPPVPILIALALGLAAIALLSKTFSLAQIALSLASALVAILIIGRTTPLASILLASAMLLALATALLLYSQANVLAIAVLGATMVAGRLAHRSNPAGGGGIPIPRDIIICLLPAAAAIIIARIDAGPISLY